MSTARFSKKTLDFIARASRQKKADWLDRNADEYEAVLVEPVRHLMGEVAKALKPIAPGYRFPSRSFARIRRSGDRAEEYGPFRDWIGMQATRDSGSRYENLPNLYFHIDEEDIYSAGGLYMPSARQTKQIRAWIAEDAKVLERLLKDRKFHAVFNSLGNERKLKTKPRDYPMDHPRIEWLKLSAFYVWRPFSKKELFSSEFPSLLTEDWKQVLRLNSVLDGYLRTWPKVEEAREELPDFRAPQVQWDED